MNHYLRLGFICLMILYVSPSWSLTHPSIVNNQVALNEVSQNIKNLLESKNSKSLIGFTIFNRLELNAYYKGHNYDPIWSREGSINQKNIHDLLSSIELAKQDGFNPSVYRGETILTLLSEKNTKKQEPMALAILDLLVSDSYYQFTKDILIGRVNPNKIYADWFYASERQDPIGLLSMVNSTKNLSEYLNNLFPNSPSYLKMRESLDYYQKLAQKGGWPQVPKAGQKWEKRQEGPHILALRKRLQATGELAKKTAVNEILFDDELEAAVIKFQKQNGLNADGVVGIYTWQALNMTAEDRIKQIIINMERYRWLPESFGEDYVFVNIPDYRVRVFKDGRVKYTTRSVVGNTKWHTPVFHDEMEYIVINPRWHVPPKIAKKEMLPKVKKDPSYLTTANFTVFKNEDGKKVKVDVDEVDWEQAQPGEYYFSQNSGNGNSLGRLKFIFPNRHSVYLHDTPTKYLFKRDIRAYSHGCIRIEDPMDLAQLLLQGTEGTKWDEAKIKDVISTNEETTVSLPKKLPIHLYYLTAWVDDEGQLQFRKDVYGYDKTLAKALRL